MACSRVHLGLVIGLADISSHTRVLPTVVLLGLFACMNRSLKLQWKLRAHPAIALLFFFPRVSLSD